MCRLCCLGVVYGMGDLLELKSNGVDREEIRPLLGIGLF